MKKDRIQAKSKRLSKKIAPNILAPKTDVIPKQVGLLLERFPDPDQKRVCLELYAPDAQVVFVAGSFNGWQPSTLPLQKQAGDRWGVELMLDPGKYEYRFVVDGEWTDDPLSSAYISNPFDGLNCVLVVDIQA
jgi:hypothetical protein